MKKEIICGDRRHEKIHLASVCSFHDESLELHTPRAGGFFFASKFVLESSWDTRTITIDFVDDSIYEWKFSRLQENLFKKNWKSLVLGEFYDQSWRQKSFYFNHWRFYVRKIVQQVVKI